MIRLLVPLILFVSSVKAQTAFITDIALPDTSLWAVDVLALNKGFILLGQLNHFEAIQGIPISGSLTYGSYVCELDSVGNTNWSTSVPTGTLDNIFNVDSYGWTPATQLMKKPGENNWLLPYSINVGFLYCEDSLSASLSGKNGLCTGRAQDGQVLNNMVFWYDSLCEKPRIIKSFAKANRITILNRNKQKNEFIHVDNGTLFSKFVSPENSYWIDAIPINSGDNYLLLAQTSIDSYELIESNQYGQVIKKTPFPFSNLLFPVRICPFGGNGYIVVHENGNPSANEPYFVIQKIDKDYKHEWYFNTNNIVIDLVITAQNELIILSKQQNIPNQENFTEIFVIDTYGNLIASKLYSIANFFPKNLIITPDSYYMFTGTVFKINNPTSPAYIKVVKENLSQLVSSGVQHSASNSIRLHPNPASNWLNVDFSNEQIRKEVYRLRIINSLGQTVYHLDLKSGGSIPPISLHQLIDGYYFVCFEGRQIQTLPFLIFRN